MFGQFPKLEKSEHEKSKPEPEEFWKFLDVGIQDISTRIKILDEVQVGKLDEVTWKCMKMYEVTSQLECHESHKKFLKRQ